MLTTSKILAATDHRPYPLPEKPWKYYQEWHDVKMMHWSVPVPLVEALLPKGLLLDTYQGEAWVSLFAFKVKRLRSRFLPPLPFLSSFNEINLRTYVIRDGKPGIYFFSVEADCLVLLLLARLATGVPYVKSEIETRYNCFVSRNKRHGYQINMNCKVKDPINADKLDLWLTERYCLYQQEGTRLYRFDIHHKQWKLRQLALALHQLEYNVGAISLTDTPALKHYSKKTAVLLWGKTLVADQNPETVIQ